MPLTKAEIKKRYYEKLKKDPIRYKAFLEKTKVKDKKYKQSEIGKKVNIVSGWKFRGIIDSDLYLLYDYYILQTNCMICGIEFKNRKDRNLDHDHITGEVRYICCSKCNSMLRTIYQ